MPRLPLLLALLVPALVAAQHPTRPAPTAAPAGRPAREAAQFDFLVGHWEVTARPKATSLATRIHGVPKLVGTWKGWRALEGNGIEDELRLLDGSGNPVTLSLAIRVWNNEERSWQTTAVDAYRGRVSTGNAHWSGTSMDAMVKGADPSGKPSLTRTRFLDITPNAFRWVQDRSLDDGKTWEEKVLVIEAKRVAATAPR